MPDRSIASAITGNSICDSVSATSPFEGDCANETMATSLIDESSSVASPCARSQHVLRERVAGEVGLAGGAPAADGVAEPEAAAVRRLHPLRLWRPHRLDPHPHADLVEGHVREPLLADRAVGAVDQDAGQRVVLPLL